MNAETRELFLKAQDGDVAARNKIMESNIPLVWSVARTMSWLRVAAEDLFQDGMVALARAIEAFDVNTNNRFSTYAYAPIKREMAASASNQRGVARLPRNIARFAERVSLAMYHGEDFEQACASVMVPKVFVACLPDAIASLKKGSGLDVRYAVKDRQLSPLESMIRKEDEDAVIAKIDKAIGERDKSIFLDSPPPKGTGNPQWRGDQYRAMADKYMMPEANMIQKVARIRRRLAKALRESA